MTEKIVAGFPVRVHTLANGARVIVTSPGHGFKFSDGTQCVPQNKEICDALTCKREEITTFHICGMRVNQIMMTLDEQQLHILSCLCQAADIILVPLPVLVALREASIRSYYPNVVAMNATPKTQRLPPDQKIVDINNWSY